MGFAGDADRIPGIDKLIQEGEEFSFGQFLCQVLFFPGHTLGHIAYWFFKEKKLFIGDTLFAMGCGRLFEGSHKQMFESLKQVKSLPLDTEVFCAHEYTEKKRPVCLKYGSSQSRFEKSYEGSLRKKDKQENLQFLFFCLRN